MNPGDGGGLCGSRGWIQGVGGLCESRGWGVFVNPGGGGSL